MLRRKSTIGLMKTGKQFYYALNDETNWTILFRVWNEENRDYEVRRAQMYMLQGFILGNYALGVKTVLTWVYNQMITRCRYVRDTYKELDIGALPPGEVVQTTWNGEMIFVRRLTKSEVT